MKKMIALIAHNSQKSSLVDFVLKQKTFFEKHVLVATNSTGGVLQEAGFDVTLVPHGPMGGDIVIGAMICKQEIKAVFFLRDLLSPQPHEPDVHALLRMCDLYNVPLATNLATAECLISALSISTF